jgi:phosphoglycerol transferase MdoB-like AlkP superfamily enzyme
MILVKNSFPHLKMNQILRDYFKIILLNATLQLILRLLETALILLNFGASNLLFQSEIVGLINDVIITNAILLIISPVFYLIFRVSEKIADRLFVILISSLSILHFIILEYFLYQLKPLDTSLYKYSIREISYTITTSNINYAKSLLLLTIIILAVYISNNILERIGYHKIKNRFVYLFLSISVLSMVLLYFSAIRLNNYSRNKSLFFYSRSISYFFQKDLDSTSPSKQAVLEFWKLYPHKSFSNINYPLLHEFKNINVLKPYFNKFDSPPNIVILIVEGLNDDFIHNYKGVNLMPFTGKLKDKSLYWNRCFTLGERSFAVVPSLLGSLPYGEKGFTLLDKLPKHLSLVSVLNANDYHTSFFYGQGAWFHQKDRFFTYNNIDLIFDNKKFAEKYPKIIVGNDNFFWGYNDKDLFNQFFEVTDTIRKEPRLDVFFTGTSHSPFSISDPDFYNAKFTKISSELKNDSNIVFFEKYQKYVKSVLFVDDALESFFKKYETRSDYDNTIFIITGDHPMTEIPIANSIKRYHVPFIIYSKKLITAKTFTHTVSHLDFYETILSFLTDYQIKVPSVSSALGSNPILDQPESEKRIAFMNDNREIIDYYSNNYFLSGEKLFTVGKDLSLSVSTDLKLLKKMQDELSIFKNTNYDVSLHDKIITDSIYFRSLGYNIIPIPPLKVTQSEIKSEYYNITDKTALKNRPISFNVSFEPLTTPDKDLSIVFQLSTNKDSLIYWQGLNVTNESKLFNAQIKIPRQNISDSVVYFNSYFWNKNSKGFKFSNLKFHLYQKNRLPNARNNSFIP